jgi:hypothetical protein
MAVSLTLQSAQVAGILLRVDGIPVLHSQALLPDQG